MRHPSTEAARPAGKGMAAGVGSAAILLAGASVAGASTIYSQTPANTFFAYTSDRDGDASDTSLLNDSHQLADDFSLASSAVARSVTWRGVYHDGNTPQFPLAFDLFVYADDGGVPDATAPLSTTSVAFAGPGDVTDTGIDLIGDVYEFQADLSPTPLAAGVTYWFSALADTTGDGDDRWYWVTDGGGATAARRADPDAGGAFQSDSIGPFYFVLDDAPLAPVPEPMAAGGGLLGLAALLLRRHARPAKERLERSCAAPALRGHAP